MDSRTLILVLAVLLYGLWLAAGLVDYLCHRWSHIERTSGVTESSYHLLQFLVLGLGLLAATLLAVTPLVLLAIVMSVAAHSVLVYRDVAYTEGRRVISPLEQHVHGYLEVLPVVAVGLLVLFEWNDVATAAWTLRWKAPPLSAAELATILGSFFVLGGTPILEELLRVSSSSQSSAGTQ
jgi:hypothetical protein